MKRDVYLLRELMLAIEQHGGGYYERFGGSKCLKDKIGEHMKLLEDHKLIQGDWKNGGERLTMSGHDVLGLIRVSSVYKEAIEAGMVKIIQNGEQEDNDEYIALPIARIIDYIIKKYFSDK